MKNLLLLLLLISSQQAFAGGGSSVGLGNPAAKNCLKLGGTLESYQTNAGEDNKCVIEEWKLFREMYDRHLVKEHHYPHMGMPNPAAVNCIDVGGQIRIMTDNDGQYGLCVVEEWKLFRTIDVVTKP